MQSRSKAPRKREQNRIERRRVIIEAATASFLSNGYAGTSMSALVTTIGGSKETLWSYFRSKEALFEAVVEDVATAFHGELAEIMVARNDLRGTLEHFCRTLLRRLESPATLAVWRLVTAETARFPIVGRVFLERAIRPVEAALANLFLSAIEKGQLREEDPIAMASMLLSLCWGRQNRTAWGEEHVSGRGSVDVDAAQFAGWFLRTFELPYQKEEDAG